MSETIYPLLKVESIQIIQDGKVLENYQGLKKVELVYEDDGKTLIIKL